MVEGQEVPMVEPADVLGIDDGALAGRGDQLQDPAFGQEAVLNFERPPDAAVGADRAFEDIDVLEKPGLDLVEDAHRVANARDGDGLVVFETSGLASRQGPAHADSAELGFREEMADERVLLILAQGVEDLREDFPDGDGPVKIGLVEGGRGVDRDHLGRTGGQVDDAYPLGRDAQRLGQDGSQDLGPDLAGRLDREDLAAQGGVPPLDDPDDDRAGRSNERARPRMFGEIFLGRGAVELADRAEVVDVVEADAPQGGQDLRGQDAPAELPVEDRGGDGHLVIESVQGGERGRVRMDGVVGTDPEALAAVDAQLVVDHGPSVPDPDGPGRTGSQAVDAADTLVLGDMDGVEVFGAHVRP